MSGQGEGREVGMEAGQGAAVRSLDSVPRALGALKAASRGVTCLWFAFLEDPSGSNEFAIRRLIRSLQWKGGKMQMK